MKFVRLVALLFVICSEVSVALDKPEISRNADESITIGGHFVHGFEYSKFMPCNPSNLGLAADFRLQAWGIWIWLPSDLARVLKSNVRYYIEATGVLRGPGHFGHLGTAPYEFQVEKLLVHHASTDPDCKSE